MRGIKMNLLIVDEQGIKKVTEEQIGHMIDEDELIDVIEAWNVYNRCYSSHCEHLQEIIDLCNSLKLECKDYQ